MTKKENQLYVVISDVFGGMGSGPRTFSKAFEDRVSEPDVHSLRLNDLTDFLSTSGSQSQVSQIVRGQLAKWDFESTLDWVGESKPNTLERRGLIYSKLQLNDELKLVLEEKFPPQLNLDRGIIIAEAHEKWYDSGKNSLSHFYWSTYEKYLRRIGWFDHNLEVLDQSTNDIMERISAPWREKAFQSKGLVVGYVQSGKTANFTGLIAKATDAGYRLIIVIAGTGDLLRNQTQRRVDKELIGKEFAVDEDGDYQGDAEVDQFVTHGGFPSQQGGVDWRRLTGQFDDYKELKAGIESLNFVSRDPTRPFFDKDNLEKATARIMVIKKQTQRLKAVNGDLNRIKTRGVRLEDIPALVIDDESDLASLNTMDPNQNREGELKRTKINEQITTLLKTLPRAQYVGYTATPNANVFVNPDDPEDLFPKDYVVSLPRPTGYVGAAEFHDASDEAEPEGFRSNKRAFVRDLKGDDSKPENLQKAIDSYILSGAIKLFRESRSDLKYRHHTMLIHEGAQKSGMTALQKQVEDQLDNCDYFGGSGLSRLEKLWNEDFQPVSRVRDEDKFSEPSDFDSLKPFVGTCWQMLYDDEQPVLIINSDRENKEKAPDFEVKRVWKILVGGTMLSRGYTVEGLTISYFRRKAGTADTLMQMGRWFGFRPGYRDLIRLFIGREEGARGTDLYKYFENICLDEAEFRKQLERYARPASGVALTPKQIPPLVSSSGLPPAAKNKMWNARVIMENMGGRRLQSTVATPDLQAAKDNQQLFSKMIGTSKLSSKVSLGLKEAGTKTGLFDAYTARIDNSEIISFLKEYEWAGEWRPYDRVVEFLANNSSENGISSWRLIAPQLKTSGPEDTLEFGGRDFTVIQRTRVEKGGRYGNYSDPEHIEVSNYLAGLNPVDGKPPLQPANSDTSNNYCSEQAVILTYLIRDKKYENHWKGHGVATVGLVLIFPNNKITVPIRYGVRSASNPDAITVRLTG